MRGRLKVFSDGLSFNLHSVWKALSEKGRRLKIFSDGLLLQLQRGRIIRVSGPFCQLGFCSQNDAACPDAAGFGRRVGLIDDERPSECFSDGLFNLQLQRGADRKIFQTAFCCNCNVGGFIRVPAILPAWLLQPK